MTGQYFIQTLKCPFLQNSAPSLQVSVDPSSFGPSLTPVFFTKITENSVRYLLKMVGWKIDDELIWFYRFWEI